jgi:hypothetical protein
MHLARVDELERIGPARNAIGWMSLTGRTTVLSVAANYSFEGCAAA